MPRGLEDRPGSPRAVDSRLVAGHESDDDGVAARAVELRTARDHHVASFDHKVGRDLAVEDVVDSGVADYVLLGAGEGNLVGLDHRDSGVGQGLQRGNAGFVV